MPVDVEPRIVSVIKNAKRSVREVSELVFLAEASMYFSDKSELLYKIRKAVSSKYNVPLHHILVCGSAHTGYSIHKQRNFAAGESDLDLAVVSPALFARFLGEVIQVTRGFSDLTGFDRKEGVSTKEAFVKYAAERGMLRPDLMPRASNRSAWFDFFAKLSTQHLPHFKKISGAIYLSEECFVAKQISSISAVRRG
jgi:predicted nucleotidyltransferase